MTREEAIDNLSVAFGECRDSIRRQAEAIEQMADDMYKLNEAFGKVKALAKSLPRQDCKSYVSPYAKFDRIRRKRK
jgi:archaellum component FlaC